MLERVGTNMTREIKFRVWDGHTKSYMHKDKETHYLPTVEVDEDTGQLSLVAKDKLYDIQLYTGLKDKNGMEIYEGDVLLQKFFEDDDGRIGIVKYEEMGGDFCGGIGFNIVDKNSNPLAIDYCEVIGNIYSNPELLKQINHE